MKQIDKILHRISILFYIFVGIFIISFCYGSHIAFSGAMAQSTVDLEQDSLWAMIVIWITILIMFVTSVWSIVLFVRLLIVIGKSIARKNIFAMQTVRLINRYAVIATILMACVLTVQLMRPDIIAPDESDTFIYMEVISGASSIVMLLMFAQVLKIGNILKQEQELTI